MDRRRVSVLVYHGKPETSVQVRKGQLPRISEATSIGYELRSYRMDVVVHNILIMFFRQDNRNAGHIFADVFIIIFRFVEFFLVWHSFILSIKIEGREVLTSRPWR